MGSREKKLRRGIFQIIYFLEIIKFNIVYKPAVKHTQHVSNTLYIGLSFLETFELISMGGYDLRCLSPLSIHGNFVSSFSMLVCSEITNFVYLDVFC